MQDSREHIIPLNIEDEMKTSYIDYAMSVIVGRALPDVRDGLKPVHRRVIYAMHELGFGPTAQDREERQERRRGAWATTTPTATPPSTTRWSAWRRTSRMRYPLVDGQGNFGSIDGDPPAAMRYTESRLSRFAELLLQRHRQEHRGLRAQLRRLADGAVGAAERLPQPAGQRQRRHRRGHGDQHPAAQPGRGHRRMRAADRQPERHGRGPDEATSRARISPRAATSTGARASSTPTRRAAAAW